MTETTALPPASPSVSSSASCATIARRVDPDRFLCALFAPQRHREALFVLIAFHHELSRAVRMPSARSGAGPIATLIRLQWWREVVENSRQDWRNHEVAAPLRALLDANVVSADTLLAMLAAREAEAEGFEDVAAWRAAMLGSEGGLQRAIATLLALDAAAQSTAAAIGAAYGTGLLYRSGGRTGLPDQTDANAMLSREGADLLASADRLIRAAPIPRAGIAAMLSLVLARRDLRRPPATGPRGLGDRLAVVSAALRGRI